MQTTYLYRSFFYSVLFLLFYALLACTPDDEEITPLSFDQLEGYWITDTWQSSTISSTLAPLTIQFTAVNKSGRFQNVPTNSWGYQENELVFRALTPDLSRNASMSGEMLIKEENSNQETWVPVNIIQFINSDELYVEVNCANCVNNTLTLRRQ